jgi:CRISPR-associated endonuclease/helicase Cas3
MEFAQQFKTLTGHEPFPWQANLYRCFAQGDVPEVCDIPTGLGKTSVIPIWADQR